MKDFRSLVEGERPYLLLAALAGEAGFAWRSNLRTWLTGILKHKIIDAVRRLAREAPLPDEESAPDGLFDGRGHWRDPPSGWEDPDASLENKQFLAALERCLAGLPQKTAQAFMMREHLGFETADICKELGVTPTHCWVLLYRARVALRECLQQSWFAK
jgi:RNA polymerase sigma-70 factor (TIGR02943 family)